MSKTVCLALLLAACGAKEEEAAKAETENAFTLAEAEVKARQAAAELMKALFAELSAALKDGEPQDALNVCADVAEAVTARVKQEQGVDVHRTSLRVRNPKNAPDDYERAWLKKAQTREKLPPMGESEVVGKELRYVRPLKLQPLCAACHGTKISPEVQAVLKQRYPEDKAVGFRPGDLRGIVSVRVPLR